MVSLGNGSPVSGTLVVLVADVDLGDAEKFASGSLLLLQSTKHTHSQTLKIFL